MKDNFFYRSVWSLVSSTVFRLVPTPFHKLRILILRMFGASVSWDCFVYPSVSIWSPRNLEMKSGSTLGPRVICYNPGKIMVGINSTVSQGVHLCSGTHDIVRENIKRSPYMPLITAPIEIKNFCWLTADVFVGPGVTINEGVIVSARSVVTKSLNGWSLYAGMPAIKIKSLNSSEEIAC